MVRRHQGRTFFVVASTLGILLGCKIGTAFRCADDQQCVLGGEPGVCTEAGYCAYRDPECPEGFRHPAGAGDGLAGNCVMPPPAGSTTATHDSTGPVASGPGSSEGGDPQTATTIATITTNTSSGGNDTTGGLCTSDPAPDDRGRTPIVDAVGCVLTIPGTVDQAEDVDWYAYRFSELCAFAQSIDVQISDDVTACAYVDCRSAVVDCGADGNEDQDGSLRGCCSETPGDSYLMDVFANCGASGSLDVWVRVEPGNAEVCDQYVIEVEALGT